jgi:hypothetical protein
LASRAAGPAAPPPALTPAEAQAIAARDAAEQLSRSLRTIHAAPEPREAREAAEML